MHNTPNYYMLQRSTVKSETAKQSLDLYEVFLPSQKYMITNYII